MHTNYSSNYYWNIFKISTAQSNTLLYTMAKGQILPLAIKWPLALLTV